MASLFTKEINRIDKNVSPYLNLETEEPCMKRKVKKDQSIKEYKIDHENALSRNEEPNKKTKFLIKLNKHIENAFPLNFFSNPTTNKNESPRKSHSTQKNQENTFLNSIKQEPNEFESLSTVQKRYQSIKVEPVSDALIMKSNERLPENICRLRSSRSLQTSIERKSIYNDSSFSFEKEKEKEENILPKTAASLENLEDEDLFNITFGNGWKNNTQKIEQNQYESFLILKKNNAKKSRIFRLRNVQSLELKKPSIRSISKNEENFKMMISEKLIDNELDFPRSERKSVTHHFKKEKVLKMYNNQDYSENKFIKLKLNVDEIIKKKTALLPKMKNNFGDFSKKEKLNKLMKLVF